MTVVVYRSTDASAPVLTGAVGDLVNLLDKCLVTGYGAKAAAGWTKPYTGTNAADFRQGAGGNSHYLSVNDNAPATAKEARVRGYEAMTASATGTMPFPTVTQKASGLFIRKSNTADATARGWILVADATTFYLFTASGDVAGVYSGFAFGDTYSLLTGDGYRTMIMGRITENSASMTMAAIETFSALPATSTGFAAQDGNYMARCWTGLGTGLNMTKVADVSIYAPSSTPSAGNGGMAFPNPPDSGIYLSRWFNQENSAQGGSYNVRRGWMRGLWQWGHPLANATDGDTFNGSGDLAGRQFLIVKAVGGTTATVVVEISNTWDTSS